MTKAEFVALVEDNGGPACVLNIICDNAIIIHYIDDDHILDIEKDIVTIGGADYIKSYTEIEDNRPEKRPYLKHITTTFHPMDMIQGVQFIESAQERAVLDKSVMHDFYG